MYLGEILYVKSDKTVEMYFDLWLYFAQVAEMMHLIASIYYNTVSSFLSLASLYWPNLLLDDNRKSRP